MGKGLPVPMVLETKDEWFEAFHNAVAERAKQGGTFTNDDMRAAGLPEPAHPNWWGTGWAAAQRAGLIEHVGFRRSATRSRRQGVTSIWQRKEHHARH